MHCILVSTAVLLGAGSVTGCGGATKTVTVTSPAAPAAGPSLEDSFVGIIDRVAPEVVQISTSQGLGSGVVLDGSGDVVTNAHVVAGARQLKITDSRGRTYPATHGR